MLFPLLIGGLIYLGFRDDSLLLFHWADILGLRSITDYIRTLLINNVSFLPHQAIYNFPGALWLYSFMSFNILLWRESTSKVKYYWFSIPPLLAINSEVLQSLGIIKGTFSIFDIYYYVVAVLFSLLLIKRRSYEKEYSY